MAQAAADMADEPSPLDTLLSKYGSSKGSIQLRESEESSTDDPVGGNGDEPSSQFLKEIRERAQILSRNAATTRKAALQNVVSDDSHVTSSGSGGTSVHLFMDVIRNADISDESVTKSPAPPNSDDDLIAYSTDDLLQSVIPLNSTPWTTEDEDEDALNISHDYMYYKGLHIQPWGTSTTEPCDDDNDSNDSDSTSQESLDSDNDATDVGDNSVCIPRKDAGQLKPDMDICEKPDLTSCVPRMTKDNTQNDVDAVYDTSLDQRFRFQPPSKEQGFEVIGMKGYQGTRTVASDEDGDSTNDDKKHKESCFNKDASDRSPDSNLLSSIQFPVETFDDDLLSVDQYSLKLQLGDAGAFEDSKLSNKTDNDADPAAVGEMHPYGLQRETHKEDDSVDDNSLRMRQDIEEETTEVMEVREEKEALWDILTQHQPASPAHDISFGLSGNDVARNAGDFNLEISIRVTEEKDDITDHKSSQYFEASSPAKDTTSAGILDDSDIVMSKRDVNEAEQNGAASRQYFRPTPQTQDTSITSLGYMPNDIDFQMYAKNQVGGEMRMENQSSPQPVLASGYGQDTAVQDGVSSALLDEMLGQDVSEETNLEGNKDDDLMLKETRELSQIQTSLDESTARGTLPSEQVSGNDKEGAEGMASYDKWSTVEEECIETRQESAESLDYFSSLLRFQDDEIPVVGTSPIAPSHSPQPLDDEDIKSKEKTVHQNVNSKGDDVYFLQTGLNQQRSTDYQKLDNFTKPSRQADAAYPCIIDYSKRTTKEPTSQQTTKDQSKETYTVKIQTSESREASPYHSHDVSITSEQQAANSEPILPYVKSNLITFNSQRSTEATGYSNNSVCPKQTRACQRQEKMWNSDHTTNSRSITHVDHETEDSKDIASTSKISPRQGQWLTKDLHVTLTEDSSSEQTDRAFSDEEPKGPGNVRSLIARFNIGSANASPVESPRSDRSFEWNVSSPSSKHKMRERFPSVGSSSPDHKTSPPHQYQDKSSDKGTNDPQDVPWMRELRERKKRREQRTVWGKLPH